MRADYPEGATSHAPPLDLRLGCASAAGKMGMRMSGHPESSQGPSDICNLYSQMLYQLSYSRLEVVTPRQAIAARWMSSVSGRA